MVAPRRCITLNTISCGSLDVRRYMLRQAEAFWMVGVFLSSASESPTGPPGELCSDRISESSLDDVSYHSLSESTLPDGEWPCLSSLFPGGLSRAPLSDSGPEPSSSLPSIFPSMLPGDPVSSSSDASLLHGFANEFEEDLSS